RVDAHDDTGEDQHAVEVVHCEGMMRLHGGYCREDQRSGTGSAEFVAQFLDSQHFRSPGLFACVLYMFLCAPLWNGGIIPYRLRQILPPRTYSKLNMSCCCGFSIFCSNCSQIFAQGRPSMSGTVYSIVWPGATGVARPSIGT